MQSISERQLNRTTLARQLLLARSSLDVRSAVSQVGGLQAQVAREPFIGLWTRLAHFERADLTQSLETRQVVRATLMRSTLQITTADDYAALRGPLQPALARALNAFFGARARNLNLEATVAQAAQFFANGPQTFADLKAHLLHFHPDQDGDALNYAARAFLALVQVPGAGKWGFPANPAYADAARWLDRPVPLSGDLRPVVEKYLKAFGPASLADLQAWSGLVKLKEPLAALRSELIAYRAPDGTEMLDWPGLSLADEDCPAPVRFLPEYDNLMVSHSDRTRVIPDAARPYIFLSAARVRSTVLVDGRVQAVWKAERNKDVVVLNVEALMPFDASVRAEIEEEGQRLLRFMEPDAAEYQVQIVAVG